VHPKRIRQTQAVSLAASLVGWSMLVGPRLPPRWHSLPHAIMGTALVTLTRAPRGLRPPALWSGVRWGLAAAAPVAMGVAAATTHPVVRVAMAERELPQPALHWLLLRIPLGTVWSEEAAFRAALALVGADGFGPTGGRLLQAIAFGLSHIPDARVTGEPMLGTVVVTGGAGWVFGWLRERSSSLAAPMLAHLVINEAFAIAALAVQARRERAAGPGRTRWPGRTR
jgi:uncharacterized protein